MTIGDINPGGWGLNDELTSPQLNLIRAGFLKALDKSVAGDTISGVVVIDATGGMTFQAGSSLTVQSTLTVQGNASWDAGSTLAMSGQITFENASQIIWKNGSLTQVQAGALWSILAGSTISCDGALTCSDITMSGTTRVKVASRDLTRLCKGDGVSPQVAGVAQFAPAAGAIGAYDQFDIVSASPRNEFNCGTPHNNKIKGFSVTFSPPGGHGGQPGNLPRATLYSRSSTGTLTAHATVFYTWVDLATYEAGPHTISTTFAPVTVDLTTNRYFIAFFGESGANAVVGLQHEHPKITETITEYDEG